MKKTLIWQTPSREILFNVAICLNMFSVILQSSVVPVSLGSNAVQIALKAIRYMSYAIAAFCILIKHYYDRVALFRIMLVMGCALINVYSFGMKSALYMLFAIAFIGMDFRRIAQAEMIVMAVFFSLIYLGSCLGLVENWEFGIDTSRPRYCMGFIYPSHTTSLFFFAVLLFCYLKGENLKLWHIALISLLDMWQYRFTDSRAGSYLALLACFCMYGMKFLPEYHVLDKSKLLRYSVLLCMLACFVATYCYQKKVINLEWMNRFLTGRLKLQASAVENFGIRLFGQKIEWYGNGGTGYTQVAPGKLYNYVDSSFMQVLFDEGLIMLLIYTVGFTAAAVYAAKQGETFLLVAIAFAALYSTVEQWMFNIGYNPFFVLIGTMFSLRKNMDEPYIVFNKQENRLKELT